MKFKQLVLLKVPNELILYCLKTDNRFGDYFKTQFLGVKLIW